MCDNENMLIIDILAESPVFHWKGNKCKLIRIVQKILYFRVTVILLGAISI